MQRSVLTTVSPGKVIVSKEIISKKLGAKEVLVDTVCSAVSSGTEMLVYRGQMPGDIAVDSTIKTLKESTFKYPIAYGYSCVGRLAKLGDEIDSGKWKIGDLVFAFREHCDRFIADECTLIKVPDAIAPENACLFPAMETAVSISFDAEVGPGESVLIVGQGSIGLLVSKTLKTLYPLSEIYAAELDERRAGIAATICRRANVNPTGTDKLLRTDITVDTSGNSSGLDTAITMCRDYGRIVLASWFGNKDVSLTSLGGAFHRSHCKIIASQVSEIPVHLRGRWTKERRYDLVWKLISLIKPADILETSYARIEDGARVFGEIEAGKHVQVVFKYKPGS